MGQQVVGQGVAQLDVLGLEALDQLVRHRDGVGFRVQLLGVGHQASIGVPFGHLLDRRGEKAAGTGRAVVHGAHHAITI
ncbi:hypothetical protein D3C84_545180 [compost metagenome]